MSLPAPSPRPQRPSRAATVVGVARAAISALRDELAAAPKPGLVSPGDPGAHRDMDEATFEASLRALPRFFVDAAGAGYDGAPFAALRTLGIAAERRMLLATGGVNTHRGAIFALGLLSAAAGRLAAAGLPWRGDAPGIVVRDAYGDAIRGLRPAAGSHGAAAAHVHGAGGAREEAARGFPSVFTVGLPALDAALRAGAERGAAAVQALMTLVAHVADTNLLHRGGAQGLAFARAAATEFVASGGVHRAGWREALADTHRAFVARNLSPGGSADLLAATLLVDRLRARP